MIIFGWRGVTFTKEQGQFHCPSCGPNINFRHKTVRNFFTLYFIPVIPLNSLGEYVECQQCQGTFHHDILNYDPAAQGQTAEAIFMVAAKQLMISMLLADGIIDDSEVKELQIIFEDLAGAEVTEEDLREEIAIVQQSDSDPLALVAEFAPTLNDRGKEILITAAYQIAIADGVVDPSERQLLHEIADTLQLSKAHLRGILAELESPAIGVN